MPGNKREGREPPRSNEIREAFARARVRLAEMRLSRDSSDRILKAHTADVDSIVVDVFEGALERSERPAAGVALIALGGYGRRELAPNSDLDLLLLHRGWTASAITALSREVMYPLWDSGRELGERVRDPRDVLRSLDRVDEACALVDARLLAGDAGLYADLESSVRRRLDRGRASFFKDLARSTQERHRRYGHAGHLLEPNLRDSAGGLRDVHTLLWASKLLPGGEGFDGLVQAGHLSSLDAHLVQDAFSFLLRLRIELHLLIGRHQDQLYLGEQDDVGGRLGYAADGASGPADRLMQELYAHARQVDAVVQSFWGRVLHGRRRRRRSPPSRPAGDGCVLVDGRLEVIAATHPRDDSAGWMKVFRRSVQLGAPVGRASLNRLHEETAGSPARWSAEARDVFLDILQSGAAGERALEAMDEGGLLSALVPEWEPIRCLPQRDLYHRYSVDRHLFAVVAELGESRSSDEADLRDGWSLVDEPAALFVAALLHDIGKGRGGDHSIVGAELAAAVSRRMGLDERRVDDITFLVLEHLTLVSMATRRDLNDDRTIEDAARTTGGFRRLAMLFLLTRADSLATGPEAWSSFRASLVRELYVKTKQRIEGVPTAPAQMSQRLSEIAAALGLGRAETERIVGPMPRWWLPGLEVPAALRQLTPLREPLASGEVRASVHSLEEADEFIVVTRDRPGLFATVAGVLALRGIDVHGADVYTRSDGVAVEVFRVRGTHGSISDDRWTRVREDITRALDGALDVDDALARKAAQTRRRRAVRRPRGTAHIVVDNRASDSHTVLEVHTEDRVGLLRMIAKTLADAGCDLSLAKVATYGVDVVDVFYVHDLEGRKITDPGEVQRLKDSLTRTLQGEGQSHR